MDLDNFKIYNDDFGHLTGDKLLKEVCALLKAHTRKEDMFFRYGGDEFVAILPNADEEDAKVFGE